MPHDAMSSASGRCRPVGDVERPVVRTDDREPEDQRRCRMREHERNGCSRLRRARPERRDRHAIVGYPLMNGHVDSTAHAHELASSCARIEARFNAPPSRDRVGGDEWCPQSIHAPDARLRTAEVPRFDRGGAELLCRTRPLTRAAPPTVPRRRECARPEGTHSYPTGTLAGQVGRQGRQGVGGKEAGGVTAADGAAEAGSGAAARPRSSSSTTIGVASMASGTNRAEPSRPRAPTNPP